MGSSRALHHASYFRYIYFDLSLDETKSEIEENELLAHPMSLSLPLVFKFGPGK